MCWGTELVQKQKSVNEAGSAGGYTREEACKAMGKEGLQGRESRDQTGSPRVMERKRRTQGCEGRIRAVPCFLGTALPSLI